MHWKPIFFVAILVAAVVLVFIFKPSKNQRAELIRKPSDEEKAKMVTLLNITAGDRPAAERLIALEKNRSPGGSRVTWIQSAIDSRERDGQNHV